MSEMKKYDYHVALIVATATEEAGLRHMYENWKPSLDGRRVTILRNLL